jgi:hypothetical protein
VGVSVVACPGVAVDTLTATLGRGVDVHVDDSHQCKPRVRVYYLSQPSVVRVFTFD